MSQRSSGVRRGEPRLDGDSDSAAMSAFRREGVFGIEAERFQRVQGSAVRNEEREFDAAYDPAKRAGVLLARDLGILLFRRVRGKGAAGVRADGVGGEAAAEGGGGDGGGGGGGGGDGV